MIDAIEEALFPHPFKKNETTLFFHPDDEESYKINLAKFGKEWYYATTEVSYKSNSLGYRTENLDYFKDKDFVLVMGCSHTEGIGMNVNEIWHKEIEKEFGFEILNAGFGGTGPDVQMINSYLFLKNSNLKPKAVVIQWPNLSRFMFKGDELKRPLLPNLQLRFDQNDSNTFFQKFLSEQRILNSFYKWWLYDNNDINNSWIFIIATRLMWQLAGIPYYDFTMEYDVYSPDHEQLDNLFYQTQNRDRARDQLHYGPQYNEELGKLVCDKLRGVYEFR